MANRPKTRVSVPVIPAAVQSPRIANLAEGLMTLASFNAYVFRNPTYNVPLRTRIRPQAAQAMAFQLMIQVWGHGELHGYKEGKITLVVPDSLPTMPDDVTGLAGFGDLLIELKEMVVRGGDLVFPTYGAAIAVTNSAERSRRYRKQRAAKRAGETLPVEEKVDPIGYHKQAVEMWCTKWSVRWGGEKYAFNGARDGKTIQWLLTAVGQDLVKLGEVMDRYLNEQDKFYADIHHPLGMLRSQFTRWQFDHQGNRNGRAAVGGVGRPGRVVAEPGKYDHLAPGSLPFEEVEPPVAGDAAGDAPVAGEIAPGDSWMPSFINRG